ncbi:MAG: DUF2971 domain-containing protein [Arcobacteraceae bacterium]
MIRFTPANDFNDPFELTPGIISLSKEWIEYISSLPKKERQNIQFNEDDMAYSITRIDELEEKKKLLNDKINNMGILSLSSNNNINQLLTVSVPDKKDPRTNILMWSHYANYHRGFVIEFKQDFIKNLDIQKVKYSSKRNILTYEDIKENNFNHILFEKSVEWAYEQEYRAILSLDKADKVLDNNIYLFKFDKSKINSITFGCKMPEENKKTIIDLIKNDQSFKGVAFNHAYINEDGYNLNFYYNDGQITNRLMYEGKVIGMQCIPMQKDLNDNKSLR